MKKKHLIAVTLMLIMLAGCGKELVNSNPDVEKQTVEEKAEGGSMNAKTLIDYYGDTLKDIPEDYIQGYIDEYNIKQEDLAKMRWDEEIISDYNDDVAVGCDPADIVTEDESDEDIATFVTDINRIYVNANVHTTGEFVEEHASVADVKEGKIYSYKGGTFDYTKAENISDLQGSKDDYADVLKKAVSEIESNDNWDVEQNLLIVIENSNNEIKKYVVSGYNTSDDSAVYELMTKYMKIEL